MDNLELVYAVMDLRLKGESTVQPYHKDVRNAQRRAEAMVGNSACAHPPHSDLYMYGPGTGETTVMVRGVPRAWLPDNAVVEP